MLRVRECLRASARINDGVVCIRSGWVSYEPLVETWGIAVIMTVAAAHEGHEVRLEKRHEAGHEVGLSWSLAALQGPGLPGSVAECQGGGAGGEGAGDAL